jgi:hypothetical protein
MSMAKANPGIQPKSRPDPRRRLFTLDEARRALPLVRRIAGDVQAAQATRVALHARLSTETIPLPADELSRVQKELDHATARLEELVEELTRIGVELKDPARVLLDFPCLHEGREILLCWKSGEETITHWH